MLILATGDGIKSLNISSRAVADTKTLTGRNVTHLHLSPSGGLFAVLDGKEVWQGPNTDDPNGDGWIKVGVISQESANCLYALDGYVLVGTDAARLECIDLSGQAGSQIVAGFDEIDGRDEWFTPWGGSPDVRAFAGSGDHIYADIHVGWVCRSDDGGQTWTNRGPATLALQMPAQLCALQDGAILLTYGVRNRGMLGVCARVSRDEGRTWDAPRVLFNTTVNIANASPEGVDGGYPSSVQLADGTIVTAYYCQRIATHQRYHMGVVLWVD